MDEVELHASFGTPNIVSESQMLLTEILIALDFGSDGIWLWLCSDLSFLEEKVCKLVLSLYQAQLIDFELLKSICIFYSI